LSFVVKSGAAHARKRHPNRKTNDLRIPLLAETLTWTSVLSLEFQPWKNRGRPGRGSAPKKSVSLVSGASRYRCLDECNCIDESQDFNGDASAESCEYEIAITRASTAWETGQWFPTNAGCTDCTACTMGRPVRWTRIGFWWGSYRAIALGPPRCDRQRVAP